MNHIDSSTISALENIHSISDRTQSKIKSALFDGLFDCEYRGNHFAVFFPGSKGKSIETECAYVWLEKRDMIFTWCWTTALNRWWMFWWLLFNTVEEEQEEPDVACKRLEVLLGKLFDELGERA